MTMSSATATPRWSRWHADSADPRVHRNEARARVAWLLRACRASAGQQDLQSFAEQAERLCPPVTRPVLERAERGEAAIHVDVLRAYERVLQLPAGQLVGVGLQLHRALGGVLELAGTTAVSRVECAERLQQLENALDAGTLDGLGWCELADLATDPAGPVILPPSIAKAWTEQLVNETLRSVGHARATRAHALSTLIADPDLGEVVARATRDASSANGAQGCSKISAPFEGELPLGRCAPTAGNRQAQIRRLLGTSPELPQAGIHASGMARYHWAVQSHGYDDDLLRELLHESLTAIPLVRRHHALSILQASPLRGLIAETSLHLVREDPGSPIGQAALASLMYLAGPEQHGELCDLLTRHSVDPGPLLIAIAHCGGIPEDVDLNEYLTDPNCASAAIYAAGMSGHPVLARIAAQPTLADAAIARHAQWWLAHGQAVTDTY